MLLTLLTTATVLQAFVVLEPTGDPAGGNHARATWPIWVATAIGVSPRLRWHSLASATTRRTTSPVSVPCSSLNAANRSRSNRAIENGVRWPTSERPSHVVSSPGTRRYRVTKARCVPTACG